MGPGFRFHAWTGLLVQVAGLVNNSEEEQVVQFLIQNLPAPDVESISADLLAENAKLAVRVRPQADTAGATLGLSSVSGW